MIQQLVVNGCSYMETYASGNGHLDLARQLGFVGKFNLPLASTLAIGGSANSRILRTTLKHSYQTSVPTLYVLGMTFLSRLELPICEPINDFEGRWCNPQNQEFSYRWQYQWDQQLTESFINTKLQSEIYSSLDRAEDLMYRMLSVIADLKSRGHSVIMFQQADDFGQDILSDPRLKLFKCAEIIQGFRWRAITWQHEQGVPKMEYGLPQVHHVPDPLAHRQSGHHQLLNDYLTNYIQEHKILS